MRKIISARDLARDIGLEFDTPDFWRYLKELGLEPIEGVSGFDADKANGVFMEERISGRLLSWLKRNRRGGRRAR